MAGPCWSRRSQRTGPVCQDLHLLKLCFWLRLVPEHLSCGGETVSTGVDTMKPVPRRWSFIICPLASRPHRAAVGSHERSRCRLCEVGTEEPQRTSERLTPFSHLLAGISPGSSYLTHKRQGGFCRQILGTLE